LSAQSPQSDNAAMPSPLRILPLLFLISGTPLIAQSSNPAAAEDAEMERRKILKAADQVDRVDAQVDKIQARVSTLEKILDEVRLQSQSLKEALANTAAKASQDRAALLEEVSKLVAERKEREKEKPAEKPLPIAKPAERDGYEHVVAKGDTLSSIAQAYSEAYKTKISVESIRKANSLAKDASLKVGQKLIIPTH
jgi:LysM repeat protein